MESRLEILAIKHVAAWARSELIREISQRLRRLGFAAPNDKTPVGHYADGRAFPLPSDSKRVVLQEAVDKHGFEELVRRCAHVWFIRLIAIRYMEVNGLIPVRLFSDGDGNFAPECMDIPMDMPLESLDTPLVAQLVQEGNDAAVFRCILLAQCQDLSQAMPFLFEKGDTASNLLAPDDLLRANGVVADLVNKIPDSSWASNLETIGYLFEGYAEERRKERLGMQRSDYRVDPITFAVSSQRCSAGWPGHFLVDNSLGKLLAANSEQLIEPASIPFAIGNAPDNAEVNLEDISIVDPACGSGMLLVYAFDLMMQAYQAQGYANRDAVSILLKKNLTGFDVDSFAAKYAKLVLCLKACEYDKRFLRRAVKPRITALEPITFSETELKHCKAVTKQADMLESASLLDSCGSLFNPSGDDICSVQKDLDKLDGSTQVTLVDKLKLLEQLLTAFSAKHDVVLCDAPRADAKRINRAYSKWIAEHYPDNARFLPASFIGRSLAALKPGGYAAIWSSSALLFSGNATDFRRNLIDTAAIECLVETTDTFGHPWCNDAAWILRPESVDRPGRFIRLNQAPGDKEQALLEAASNPAVSHVYERRPKLFKRIPGCPIAYWAPTAIVRPFSNAKPVSYYAEARTGLSTGNSNRFLRQWYELSQYDQGWGYHPFANSGAARKWYGNRDLVIRWANDGEELKHSYSASSLGMDSHFKQGIVWGAGLNFRLLDSAETMVGNTGILIPQPSRLLYLLALLNSSSFRLLYRTVNSENNATSGEIGSTPAPWNANLMTEVENLAQECVDASRSDYNESETSPTFCAHPLR